MIKRKLKPFVIPSLYTLAIILFVFSIYFFQNTIKGVFLSNDDVNTEYVDDDIVEDEQYIPVVNTKIEIIKPFINNKVTIAKSYYDYKAEADSQKNSIIYYENIYMQNSGVDYKLEEVFDVVSVLDGKVISVEDNDMMGTTVQIKHDNNLISVYQSLSNVKVKVDDTVIQGQVIAQSGESNINKDLGNHLHFELYHNGNIVNPEEYYNKSIEEL